MIDLTVPNLEKTLVDMLTRDYPAPHCGRLDEIGGSRPRDECATVGDEETKQPWLPIGMETMEDYTGGGEHGWSEDHQTYTVYHGARNPKVVEEIKKEGLRPPEGTGVKWYMLTTDIDEARVFAGEHFAEGTEKGLVLEYRIPRNEVSKYLWTGILTSGHYMNRDQVFHSIREHLPGKYIVGEHSLIERDSKKLHTDSYFISPTIVGRSRHSRGKCMDCSNKPIVACHWADGRGMAWFCLKHLKAWLKEDERELVGVWFLKDDEMPKDIRKNPAGTVKILKLSETLSHQKILSRLEKLTERGDPSGGHHITQDDLLDVLRGDLITQGQLRRVVSIDDGPFLIIADYPDLKHDKSEEIEISLPVKEQYEQESNQDDVGDETIRIDKKTDERKGLLNNVRRSLENLVVKVLEVVRVGGGLGQKDKASTEVNAAPIDTEPGQRQANIIEALPEDPKKVIKVGKFDKETIRRILIQADKTIEFAIDEETCTSPLIQKLAQQFDAQIEGFDYRIKGRDSLARKIATDMVEKNLNAEEAASDITDAIRYTLVFDTDLFVDQVAKVQDTLIAEGWTQYDQKWKNYFPTGDGYDGYNTVMENPETGERFELQFHTPETWQHKMDSHSLYEELRVLPQGSPRRLQIWNQMVQSAEALTRPTGWDRLRGQQVVRQ